MTNSAGTLIRLLLIVILIWAAFGDECNDNSDCFDNDPCTTDICNVYTNECEFDPIDGCLKCPGASGDTIGCIPLDDCHTVQCGNSSTAACENIAISCPKASKNFTSLGVMLAILVIYVIGMIFAVRKDRSENIADEKSVAVGEVNPISVNSEDSVEQGTKKNEKGGDDGCCECCDCGGCCCDDTSSAAEKKDKKAKKKEEKKDDECCACLRILCCKYPLTRADKITIMFSMIYMNILLSAGLNDKGVAPSKAQQYVIGLISGSAGIPPKTIISWLFGKIPKKYFYIPYGATYSICIMCFVVTLVYTIEFEQAKANKWLVSTGISTLEDICLIAIGFAIIYFCPSCTCLANKM